MTLWQERKFLLGNILSGLLLLCDVVNYIHFLGSEYLKFRAQNWEFLSISLLKNDNLCLLKSRTLQCKDVRQQEDIFQGLL